MLESLDITYSFLMLSFIALVVWFLFHLSLQKRSNFDVKYLDFIWLFAGSISLIGQLGAIKDYSLEQKQNSMEGVVKAVEEKLQHFDTKTMELKCQPGSQCEQGNIVDMSSPMNSYVQEDFQINFLRELNDQVKSQVNEIKASRQMGAFEAGLISSAPIIFVLALGIRLAKTSLEISRANLHKTAQKNNSGK
ncbi:hypothetical protein [Idiomarina abyssalis]|uniref:hypothetical protein n=1 Tax=Idiomarina abyssalis TaxID=86102 RepID=UPI003A93DC6B